MSSATSIPLSVSLALAVSLAAGCVDGPSDLRHDDSAIVGGEVTEAFEAVVAIYFHISLAEGGALCSGTLVNDSWVLTAAHCPPNSFDEDASRVFFGWDIYGDDVVELTFDEWHRHPDYNGLAGDVAVVHLDEPVDVAPIPINRDDPIDNRLVGEEFTFVGFGLSDPFADQVDGKKRVAEIEMTDTTGTIFYYFDDDAMTSNGDSGGPALYDFGDGLRVVGVTSWGSNPDDFGVSTAVDVHADWIDGYTGGDAVPPADDDDEDDDELGDDDDGDQGCRATLAGSPSAPLLSTIAVLTALALRRRGLRR